MPIEIVSSLVFELYVAVTGFLWMITILIGFFVGVLFQVDRAMADIVDAIRDLDKDISKKTATK